MIFFKIAFEKRRKVAWKSLKKERLFLEEGIQSVSRYSRKVLAWCLQDIFSSKVISEFIPDMAKYCYEKQKSMHREQRKTISQQVLTSDAPAWFAYEAR